MHARVIAITALICLWGCASAQPPELPGTITDESVVWTDALDIGLEGQGWSDLAHPYDRYPAHAEGVVREPVWDLAHHTAGLALHFISDSPEIFARWTLRNAGLSMFHMPATGMSGLDLYALDGDTWRFVGVGRPRHSPINEVTLVGDVPPGMHEYLLHLPLYNGVESLEIGTVAGSVIEPSEPREGKPLCFYGTSITQGGCASRPGMSYPAILARRLGRESINLGFSGNGRMEPEVADLLAELDPALYVIDCFPNMETDGVNERAVNFIRTLRAAHPDTPIVILDNIEYQSAWFEASVAETRREKNEAIRSAYETLVAEGVTGLHFVVSDDLLGHDSEAAVDGVHLTDLGFMRMADALEPVLRSIVEE